MPRIDFTFRGNIDGALILKATITETGEKIDVRKMSPYDLQLKLNSGELCISLGDYLYNCDDAEICMEDFEVSSSCWPDEA